MAKTEKTVEAGVGKTIDVSSTSYDPGYPLGQSLDGASLADLKRGYCTYGKLTGEGGKSGLND